MSYLTRQARAWVGIVLYCTGQAFTLFGAGLCLAASWLVPDDFNQE